MAYQRTNVQTLQSRTATDNVVPVGKFLTSMKTLRAVVEKADQLRIDVQERDRVIERLGDQLTQAQNELENLRRQPSSNPQISAQLREKENIITQLRAQLATTQNQRQTIAQLQQENQRLQEELESAKQTSSTPVYAGTDQYEVEMEALLKHALREIPPIPAKYAHLYK